MLAYSLILRIDSFFHLVQDDFLRGIDDELVRHDLRITHLNNVLMPLLGFALDPQMLDLVQQPLDLRILSTYHFVLRQALGL